MNIITKYFTSGIVNVSSLFFQFIWLSVMSKFYGTVAVGQYLETIFYLGTVFLFSNIGLNEFLLKNYDDFFSKKYLRDTGTSLVLVILQLLLALPFLFLINFLMSINIFLGITFIFAQSVLDVGAIRQRCEGKGASAIFFQLLLPNFFFLLLIQFVKDLYPGITFLSCMILSMLLSFVIREIYSILSFKKFNEMKIEIPISEVFNKLKFKSLELIKFYLLAIFMFCASQGDFLLISLLLSASEFGLYSIVMKIGTLSIIGLVVFNIKSKHKFAEAFREQRLDQFKKLENESFYLSVPIPLIAIILCFILIQLNLNTFLNWDLKQLLPLAINILFYQIISTMLGPVNSIVTMVGKPEIVLKSRVLSLIYSSIILIGLFFLENTMFVVLNFAGMNLILWKIISTHLLYKETGIVSGWKRIFIK